MKNGRMAIWLVVAMVAVMAVEVQSQNFTLTGTQEKDIATSYSSGYLYDHSIARILTGGSVDAISARNTSTVNITGGEITGPWGLRAYDTSTVEISSGSVAHLLESQDTSIVNISGGKVNNFYAFNLRSDSGDRINITGGSVETLQTNIHVIGTEHFSLTTDLTLSDLEGYGVRAADGTVSSVRLRELYVYDTSMVNITGGSVGNLWTWNTSTATISSGNMDWFRAADTSTVVISGGSVGELMTCHSITAEIFGGNVDLLRAYDTSTLEMSGGSVSEFHVYNTSTVAISGGNMNRLYAYDTSTVNITGGMIDEIWAGASNRESYATIIILGENFECSDGLSLIGNELFGTGTLSGQWLDGTEWSTEIMWNEETATIMLIPEPMTLLLLGIGGLLIRKR